MYLLKIKKSDEPSAKLTSTRGISNVDLSSINEKDGKNPKYFKGNVILKKCLVHTWIHNLPRFVIGRSIGNLGRL